MKVEKNSAGRKWIIEHSRGNRGRVVLLSTLCMISSLMGVFLALALVPIVVVIVIMKFNPQDVI